MSISREGFTRLLALFIGTLAMLGVMQPPLLAHAEVGSCSQLVPQIKDDRVSPPEWVDPASISFALGDASRKDLPESLGPVQAGPAYMIGATQESGVPWLGVNTMHPSLLENTTGDVTWELSSFEGPGSMYVFTQGNLGQVVGEEWFRGQGTAGEGTTVVRRNSHVHPNWVFSDAGTYHVQLTQTVQLTSGETASGTGTLTFEVGTGGGTATEGHFDFGAIIDGSGNCAGAGQSNTESATGVASGNGAAGASGASNAGQGTASTGGGTASGNSAAGKSAASASTSGAANSASGTANSGAAGAKAATAGTSPNGATSTAGKKLPETGTTVMTFPIAFLGLGFLALGAGLIFAIRKYTW